MGGSFQSFTKITDNALSSIREELERRGGQKGRDAEKIRCFGWENV